MHSADGGADETEERIWDLTQSINVKGVWFGCKHAILAMKKVRRYSQSVAPCSCCRDELADGRTRRTRLRASVSADPSSTRRRWWLSLERRRRNWLVSVGCQPTRTVCSAPHSRNGQSTSDRADLRYCIQGRRARLDPRTGDGARARWHPVQRPLPVSRRLSSAGRQLHPPPRAAPAYHPLSPLPTLSTLPTLPATYSLPECRAHPSGPLKTPLLMDFLNTPEKLHRRLVHSPMGRFGEAIEQALAVVFRAWHGSINRGVGGARADRSGLGRLELRQRHRLPRGRRPDKVLRGESTPVRSRCGADVQTADGPSMTGPENQAGTLGL